MFEVLLIYCGYLKDSIEDNHRTHTHSLSPFFSCSLGLQCLRQVFNSISHYLETSETGRDILDDDDDADR